MEPGPATLCDLKSLLGDPLKGGCPEDVAVVASWETFVERHPDTFAYEAATRTLRLRAPATHQVSGSTAVDSPVPGDQRSVRVDVEACESHHVGTVVDDAASGSLRLIAVSGDHAIGAQAEAQLQHGSGHVGLCSDSNSRSVRNLPT